MKKSDFKRFNKKKFKPKQALSDSEDEEAKNPIDFDENLDERSEAEVQEQPSNPNKHKIESVWEDPDDKEVQINLANTARLRKLRKNNDETIVTGEEYQERLQNYYNTTKSSSAFYQWASEEPEQIEESSMLDNILKTNTGLFDAEHRENIPGEIIKLSKIASLSAETRHKSVIQALDFHKNNTTFLTAGLDKTMKIFSLSKSVDSHKFDVRPLKSLHLKNLPILTARFTSETNQIIATGLKNYILSFDMVKENFDKSSPSFVTERLNGKIKNFVVSPDEQFIALYGFNQYIMIISAKTKQLIHEFRLNSECSGCTFSPDGSLLFACTEDGNIYEWDLGSKKIIDMFSDSGSLKTNALDFSNDSSHLITGNSVGIANLYSFNQKTKAINHTPIKEVSNLTTSLDNVKFHPESEVAVISSKWKKNAIRLVHLPTKTVFSNWPNMRTKIGVISKVEYSSDGRFMAIGNDLGNVIVYNFLHYN